GRRPRDGRQHQPNSLPARPVSVDRSSPLPSPAGISPLGVSLSIMAGSAPASCDCTDSEFMLSFPAAWPIRLPRPRFSSGWPSGPLVTLGLGPVPIHDATWLARPLAARIFCRPEIPPACSSSWLTTPTMPPLPPPRPPKPPSTLFNMTLFPLNSYE